MSLHIVRSTHLEELATALAAAQRAEPFAPQAVVIGSKTFLADAIGVAFGARPAGQRAERCGSPA